MANSVVHINLLEPKDIGQGKFFQLTCAGCKLELGKAVYLIQFKIRLNERPHWKILAAYRTCKYCRNRLMIPILFHDRESVRLEINRIFMEIGKNFSYLGTLELIDGALVFPQILQ